MAGGVIAAYMPSGMGGEPDSGIVGKDAESEEAQEHANSGSLAQYA